MSDGREEVPIIRIEQAGEIGKVARGRYRIPITYVLEDDRRISGSVHRSLLRDAKSYVAALPGAPRNPLKACFTDGRFWGTTETWRTEDLMATLGAS